MRRMVVAILFTMTLVGCAKATIRPDGSNQVLSSEPDFQESKVFLLAGLVGDKDVDIKDVCGQAGEAKQMQTSFSFGNSLVYVLTLGIIAPKTVSVWCKN